LATFILKSAELEHRMYTNHHQQQPHHMRVYLPRIMDAVCP